VLEFFGGHVHHLLCSLNTADRFVTLEHLDRSNTEIVRNSFLFMVKTRANGVKQCLIPDSPNFVNVLRSYQVLKAYETCIVQFLVQFLKDDRFA
jgi:hypothetical protein